MAQATARCLVRRYTQSCITTQAIRGLTAKPCSIRPGGIRQPCTCSAAQQEILVHAVGEPVDDAKAVHASTSDSSICPDLQLVVECSFISLCNNKEMRSLAKQLEYTMSICRRSPLSVDLVFAGYGGELADHAAVMGSHGWAARMVPQTALELFDPSQLVVLSPDAQEPLEEVVSGKVYCIGGIVDRAIIKGVTHSFASSHSLQCRRLPIREHAAELGMQPRTNMNPVLNVNDVAAALLEYRSSGSWVQALQAAVPQRKRVAKITAKPKRQRARSLQHLFESGAAVAGVGHQQSGEALGVGAAVAEEVVRT